MRHDHTLSQRNKKTKTASEEGGEGRGLEKSLKRENKQHRGDLRKKKEG